MKIIRYLDFQNRERFGRLLPDHVEILEGHPFGGFKFTGRRDRVKKLLTPIQPTSILCIGLNYRQHAIESGVRAPNLPVMFVKGLNTLQNPGDPIELPVGLPSNKVDYKCELAVVIGKTCKNITRKDALKYVLGYTCANDVSARDWGGRKGGGQWYRGKFFDTFAPLGPCLVTADEISNPNTLALSTTLNGETVQSWRTDDMIFDVPTLIEFLSGSTTLWPGTVILTGTPPGVGMAATPPRWLRAGDTVTVEIEKIGRLTNPIRKEVLV